MPTSICSACGRPTDEHDRHVRFTLPDPVLASPKQERAKGTWMSHETARESVLLQVPHVGAFVRSLLPVHLTGGDSITFGVWLAIDPRDYALRRLNEVWWDDTRYPSLRIQGWLANDLAPWQGLLSAPVAAAVLDEDDTPYCVASTHETLSRVLTDEWDRDWVLGAAPGR